MDGPPATARLFAEVIALRLVLQRVNAHIGQVMGDMPRYLQDEHKAALDDLSRMQIADDNPERAAEILMMSESVIDQIYGVMREGKPGQ